MDWFQIPLKDGEKQYLIGLPSFPNKTDFNCPTILVSAVDEADAIRIVRNLKGNVLIGKIKSFDKTA